MSAVSEPRTPAPDASLRRVDPTPPLPPLPADPAERRREMNVRGW